LERSSAPTFFDPEIIDIAIERRTKILLLAIMLCGHRSLLCSWSDRPLQNSNEFGWVLSEESKPPSVHSSIRLSAILEGATGRSLSRKKIFAQMPSPWLAPTGIRPFHPRYATSSFRNHSIIHIMVSFLCQSQNSRPHAISASVCPVVEGLSSRLIRRGGCSSSLKG